MITKIGKALDEGGFPLLIQRTYNYIHELLRDSLPHTAYRIGCVNYSGKVGDRWNTQRTTDDPSYKWEARKAVKEYVQPGDKCICIGGGHGITATHLAQHGSEVLVYEPAQQMIENTDRTLRANGFIPISDYDIRPGIFYESKEDVVWGTLHPSTEELTGKNIQFCDVLEVDCEGAELQILEDLQVEPRVLIIEVHMCFGVSYSEVVRQLDSMGYSIDLEFESKYNRTKQVVAVKD